jgi:hypothetical protein
MMRILPVPVLDLLKRLDAPPRLVAHLTLVHAVAFTLIQQLAIKWPDLKFDDEAVLFGAATHDIGKVHHREEPTGPGRQHEDAGPAQLIEEGFSSEHARFARTHGAWAIDSDTTVEDLLVALADTIWKGARDQHLEDRLVQRVARITNEEPWAVYMQLDEILQFIGRDADARLGWQARHPV